MKAVRIPFLEYEIILFDDIMSDYNNSNCIPWYDKKTICENIHTKDLLYMKIDNMALFKGVCGYEEPGDHVRNTLKQAIKRNSLYFDKYDNVENMSVEEAECYLLLNGYEKI